MSDFEIPKCDETKELQDILRMMDKHLERYPLKARNQQRKAQDEVTAFHSALPFTVLSESLPASTARRWWSRQSIVSFLQESLWYVWWLSLGLVGLVVYFFLFAFRPDLFP